MDSEVDKGQDTKNILAEKENTNQLLKKKLKVPSIQLIQAYELTYLEKGKEIISRELNYCNAKFLKLAGE